MFPSWLDMSTVSERRKVQRSNVGLPIFAAALRAQDVDLNIGGE